MVDRTCNTRSLEAMGEERDLGISDGPFVSMQPCENLWSSTLSDIEVTSGEDSGNVVPRDPRRGHCVTHVRYVSPRAPSIRLKIGTRIMAFRHEED